MIVAPYFAHQRKERTGLEEHGNPVADYHEWSSDSQRRQDQHHEHHAEGRE